MKRTTYILIGLFVVCILGMIGFLVLFSYGDGKYPFAVGLTTVQKEMKIEKIRVFRLRCDGQTVEGLPIKAMGKLTVGRSSDAAGGTMFSYPDCEQVEVRQVEDTLFVDLRLNTLEAPLGSKIMGAMFVENIRMDLKVDSMLSYVWISNMATDLQMSGLRSDSLYLEMYSPVLGSSMYANSSVSIDSCQLRSLDIGGNGGVEFKGNGSIIDNLYINLNQVWRWKFAGCKIDTEHLRGTGWHSRHIGEGECKHLKWEPLSKNAVLNLEFTEKTSLQIGE